jgi:hypothetical protein
MIGIDHSTINDPCTNVEHVRPTCSPVYLYEIEEGTTMKRYRSIFMAGFEEQRVAPNVAVELGLVHH